MDNEANKFIKAVAEGEFSVQDTVAQSGMLKNE